MDRNHNWYPQNNGYYNPNDGYQRQTEPQSTNTPESGVAAGSVDNAQRLLAIYPMASATPTHHVARHLNNMHFNAAPPSFARPTYYAPPNSFHANGNPPPYSEYDQQISYLGSSQLPVRNSEYWESTRNDAVRLLGDAGPSSYPYQTPYHWGPSLAAPSSFQTPHFAQSIFHHAAPSSAYPTPPPPTMTSSSSSLAFALGPPAPRERPRTPPQPKVYPPKDSGRFFNDFIARKTQEMNAPAQPVNHTITQIQTPRRNQVPQVEESPDPLALKPVSSRMSVSPLKRKVEVVVEVESPSVKKRIHYLETTKNEPHKSNDLPITPKQPTKPGTKPLPTSILKKSFPSTPTPKRGVNLAYVEVKQRPWLTPTSSFKGSSNSVVVNKGGRKLDDTPNDLGGYGSEEDDFRSPLHGRHIGDSVKSSARRTGDRDERAPLEKLIALIEDIFEAEDSLPPDADAKDLPAEYFSPLTSDSSHPMLHPNIIKKLTKYIGQVSRPTKRLRQGATGSMGTPRVKGRMAEVDTQVLSRVLKLLDRNVKAGEDVDPFHYVATSFSAKASPRKSASKKTARPKNDQRTSQSPNLDQVDFAPSRELNESDFDKLARLLDLARDSIIAADCCIALLGSDRLAKQLYSEELITGCLNSIKNQLTQIIYPFVEASADPGFNANNNPLLFHVVRNNDSVSQSRRNQLSETFQALSAVLPRINALINAESVSMSDSIIIQAVYISIGPFFVVEGGSADVKGKKDSVVLKTLGKSAMRGLRLDALALIRSIFANHEDQRSWIIEEILTSLIKLSDTKQKAGQFRLRDGRSIRTVSALLLQLVQTSAHDVRIDARKIEKSRQNKIALRRQESFSESQQQINESFLDENDREEIRLYTSGLESATKAAKTIILFLTQRSGKGKATKNSNEAEYRAIFDNLIEDLLVVLYWPEWPAAGILLSIVSKYMVSSLDDVKFNTQTDSNAAKTISLDHLGVIAARIRSSTLKVQNGSVESGPDFIGLKPLDEVVSKLSNKELEKLLEAHRDVASHLCKRSSEDQAYDSARELTAAALGQELALALKQVNTWIEEPDADEDMDLLKGGDRTLYFGRKIKTALREVWKDPSTDVFDIGSPEEVIRIDRLAEEIGTIQSLRNSFQPILSIILLALDSPAIFMRTKALRALGQIVTSDSTILSAPNVRRGIESHLLDSSPAVRDAAVELIGKYMIDSPEVAGDYYQKIADRIADTGLSVRKRVIKLLKSFYNVTDDNARKIDITTRLVLRMLDEDDTVKDLAMKTLEEIWFSSSNPSVTRSKNIPISSSQENKSALLTKVVVIMGTSANFKDRQSPLEDMLHKIMADKQGNEAVSLHSRYAEICETLIDGLVDASDLPGFTVINCIRTIYLLTSAYPSILSSSNASTLLPYLKNASSAEELATSDYLLKIFRVSIPHMPKTAAKFGQELQSALQPMIIKPSSGGGGVQVLQEAVGCMCIVVQHLTHDFIRLVNLMKSCNARLQQAIKRPATQAMTPNDVRPLLILIFIVSLLGENCNFDRLRQENPNLASEISSISQGPIIDHIYNSLLNLYDKYDSQSIRARILQCLGFLFRAQPTLMTMERSATIMDAIFASPEVEGCGRLLKIMQDFLVSEASKHSAKEKEGTKGKPTEVDMEELVGNTDGFADSGVSSAIVQRYLNPILDAALSQHMQIQATAIDVLSFTIKQGLAHPLQSFPVIVALETSPVTSLSNRASALHAILHGKHASLLNTRYTISARTSFDYQKKIASGTFRGFRETPAPVALLQRWYSLVREKRPTRQDFLKSLVKVFQENPTYRSSQDDVDFTRYMAENFSAFDYKTQEEVITVIKYLTSVLSTIGMHLLEIVSPSHLLTQLHAPSQPFTQQTQEALVPSPAPISASQPITTEVHQVIPVEADNKHLPSDDQDRIMLMRTTVIIAMVMLLKAHLKSLYSLSEDKCNKFVIGKKSAIGDKPAVRRHEKPMSWDRLPFATTPLLTTDDADVQKSRFLEIWNEDGLTAEPEDDYI